MTPAREREWAERIAEAVEALTFFGIGNKFHLLMPKLAALLAAFAKEVREEERREVFSEAAAATHACAHGNGSLAALRASFLAQTREDGGAS